MIGLQELVLNNNTNVYKLAEELGISPNSIYRWFIVNKVPNKYIKYLSEKYTVKEEYINKIVNSISTYQPKGKSFNDYEIRGDITAIFLENKKGLKQETLIDTEDLERIKAMGLHWHLRLEPTHKYYYAGATGRKTKGQKSNYYLQMVIMNVDFDKNNIQVVDHIDQDKLNNRKYNLRIINKSNNAKHRKNKNINNSSGYRNVCWVSSKEQWRVQLQINGKCVRFGDFDDVDEAGELAKKLREKYYGEFKGGN